MKNLSILFIFTLFFCNQRLYAQNKQKDIFENVVNEVSEDSIVSYIRSLQDFGTRYALSDNRKEVALWIKSKFESFGYTDVKLDSFEFQRYGNIYWQYNVICKSDNPYNLDRYSLLGAHHDAITYENPFDSAPGADDNASGVAGVLETARVIKMHANLEYPVYFATWAAEEFGLHGSFDYAEKKSLEFNLPEFYFNLDMISNSEGDTYLVDFESSEQFFELGAIVQEYANLGIIHDETSSSSDHASFRHKGVPVMYFAEHYFSDVYHSEADVLDNCETGFAKEVTKATAFLMYYVNKINQPVNLEAIANAGDGTSLIAKWQHQEEAEKYFIELMIDDTVYTTIETTEDSIIISGLPENELVKFVIRGIDSENLPGLSTNKNLRLSTIPPELAISVDLDCQNIQFTWDTFLPLDCEKVKFERKENDQWVEVIESDPYAGTTTVHSHPEGTWEYQAILTDSLDNESVSESFYVYSTSKVEDIMVVVGSLGGYGNVTFEEVEEFYDSILPKKPKHILYEPISKKIIPTVLNMEVLIWISFLPYGSFDEYYELFDNFLEKGGKMIITGKDAHMMIDPENTSNTDLDQSAMTARLGILKALEVDNSRLFRIEHQSGTEASLNPSKVPSTMTEGVTNYVAFEPSETGELIASYQSGFDTYPENALDGEAIAIKVANDSTNSIVLGIPMYYLNTSEAKNLLYTFLNEELEVGINPKNLVLGKLSVYPNPASDHVVLKNNSDMQLHAIVRLIDVQGTIRSTSIMNFEGHGQKTLNTNNLDPGIYILEVQHQQNEHIRLIIE